LLRLVTNRVRPSADEGCPKLGAARGRAGPVVVLLAQPDVLLESGFRELDGALPDGNIHPCLQVRVVRVGVIVRLRVAIDVT
jgi:hypothetical protein